MRALCLLSLSLVASTVFAQRASTFEFDDEQSDLQRPSVTLIQTTPRGAPAESNTSTASPLRRAQLELQRGEAIFVRAMELLEQAYESRDPVLTERLREQSDELHEQAKVAYRAAEQILEGALEQRPIPYSRETGVSMWTRLHLLSTLERHAEAAVLARTFMRECADCPHAADAAVLLGDLAFTRDLDDAERAYRAATSVRRAAPTVRAYAHYKLAWIGLNRGDWAMSLDALRHARNLGGTSLRREVVRDVARVVVMRQPFDPQEILDACRPFADDDVAYVQLIDRVEDQLRDEGRDTDAQALHRAR